MRANYLRTPRQVQKEVDKILDERAQITATKELAKAQYFTILAYNRALGIGIKRVQKVLDILPALTEEYGGYKTDDIADEMLLRALQDMGFDIDRLYPEEIGE